MYNLKRGVRLWCLSLLLFYVTIFLACKGGNKKTTEQESMATMTYEVVDRYAHNEKDFTQGLLYNQGIVLESTGQHGHSRILRYAPNKREDGEELVKLSGDFFGEGITRLDDKLYQLTWKQHKMFVYDYPSMQPEKTVPINFEGWGITNDDRYIIVSDGTSLLRWLDPQDNFEEVKQVRVHDAYGAVDYINELELVDGMLYANRWKTNFIFRIDTATGSVQSKLNIASLLLDAKGKNAYADVPNGIAYIPEEKLFLLTGKYWPYLYKVRLEISN